MVEYTGGCFCGAIRYFAAGEPIWAAHCHCESCRRTTGSPMTSFLGMTRKGVTWEGQRTVRESSPEVFRGFCGTCGTPVSYESSRWPTETHLYAATLDHPEVYIPQAHVFWSERLPWMTIADDLPKYDGGSPGASS
ncbi:MAG: GFA family protein [Ruegeria sp.]